MEQFQTIHLPRRLAEQAGERASRTSSVPNSRLWPTIVLIGALVLALYPAAAGAAPPTVTTGAPEYHPGNIATIFGSGWAAGDTVTLVISEDPANNPAVSLTVTADGSGDFRTEDFTVPDDAAGTNFTVTAMDQGGATAQVMFNDDGSPGALCADVVDHGASVCPTATGATGVVGQGNTHYAQPANSTATYEIVNATDAFVEDVDGDCLAGQVKVLVKSSAVGNTLVCGDLSDSTIMIGGVSTSVPTITFQWPAQVPPDCQTMVVAYKVGTTGSSDQFSNTSNDVIADDVYDNTPQASAGIGAVNPSGNLFDCSATTTTSTTTKTSTTTTTAPPTTTSTTTSTTTTTQPPIQCCVQSSPMGAFNCIVVSATQCAAQHGTSFGAGACSPSPCPTTTTSTSSSTTSTSTTTSSTTTTAPPTTTTSTSTTTPPPTTTTSTTLSTTTTTPTTTTTSTTPSTTTTSTAPSTSTTTSRPTTTTTTTRPPSTTTSTTLSTTTTRPTTTTSTTTSSTTTTTACTCSSSSISSNFNGTPIAGGNYLWFNSVMKVSGLGSSPVTIRFTGSSITFTANNAYYTLNVPNAKITFANVTTATTTFNTVTNTWESTLPLSGLAGNVFLDGMAFQVPSGGFPGGIKPVTWSGTFTSDTPGVGISSQWAAGVYTSFSTSYNLLGVKPVDDNKASGYKNSDHAGTPENYKSSVAGGATGGGGSNFTGSYSGTTSVNCQCARVASLSAQPSDGSSVLTASPLAAGRIIATGTLLMNAPDARTG